MGEEASEFLHKSGGELWTMVRDDFVMETKASEDMFEKQGGDTSSINGFGTRDKNHPLFKPMVNHDQNKVKTGENWEICDHIAGDLWEQMGGGEQDGTEPRDSQVSVNLVSLASDTASYKSANKGG